MLALMPPHQGGLLPLSLGLLHPQEIIRECTVDIFNELRQYPVRFPISLYSSYLTSAPGALGRGFTPTVSESLPEICICEASGGTESQVTERAESTVCTPTAATNRPHLFAENTFEP